MDGSRGYNVKQYVSQRKTNTVLFHSYIKFKKQNMKNGEKRDKHKKRLLILKNKLMVARRQWVSGDG